MAVLNYAKKRLSPVITKYGIDVETDAIFQTIIPMFHNQPDYQIWALKLIKEGITVLETIKNIKNWAESNPTEIKNLIKKNIISYKTKEEIEMLTKETLGLELLKEIRNGVNKFNTTQRNMLNENLQLDSCEMNGLFAYNSAQIVEWASIMKAFNKMPIHRQNKLIRTSSAINDDFKFLKQHLLDSFAEGYVWDREDLLRYMQLKAHDCTVVFDENNILMLQVPSFQSSKALCGSGRTSWCLTRAESYFKDYVINKNAKQFFVFDFNKTENDELSHIGFTVHKNNGITNAHSTTNQSLMGDINYKGQQVNIHKILNTLHIGHQVYLRLDNLTNFDWTMQSITDYVNKRADLQIVYTANDVIVVRIDHTDALRSILSHSRINFNNFRIDSNSSAYVIMNLNVPYNDDSALGLCIYQKDAYGVESFKNCYDVYGGKNDANFLTNFGVQGKDFLSAIKIKPELMLHKLIDQRDENGIVSFLAENDNMDINITHQFSQPIFKIIEEAMAKAFNAIIQHKRMNWEITDEVGDSIFSNLIEAYLYETDQKRMKVYEGMINSILSLNINFNVLDVVGDTMLILAAESNRGEWIVRKLLKNPAVNVNIVNDSNRTALTNAIKERHISIIQLLLKRPDTVIRQEDYELASSCSIDLEEIEKNTRQKKTFSQIFETAMSN